MTHKEDELIKKGWQQRFIASEPRLSEMTAMYKETGFDVHLEPLAAIEEPDEDREEFQGCRICFEGFEDEYKMIYTRPRKGSIRKQKKET